METELFESKRKSGALINELDLRMQHTLNELRTFPQIGQFGTISLSMDSMDARSGSLEADEVDGVGATEGSCSIFTFAGSILMSLAGGASSSLLASLTALAEEKPLSKHLLT